MGISFFKSFLGSFAAFAFALLPDIAQGDSSDISPEPTTITSLSLDQLDNLIEELGESEEFLYMLKLRSISPVDGREILFTKELSKYLSEGALHQERMKLQLINLKFICQSDFLSEYRRPLTEEELQLIDKKINDISFLDAMKAAEYDHFGRNGRKPLEHDVKSTEYCIRDWLSTTTLSDLQEFAYFPFTSEDLNNLAYNRMLDKAMNEVWLPAFLEACNLIAEFALENKDVPVLGLTHGQPASTTTMGKRFGEFLYELTEPLKDLSTLTLDAKCSGPVGNHNAVTLLFKDADYPTHAKKFVTSLGFDYQEVANQRNNHIRIGKMFDSIVTINTIIKNCSNNMWMNISNNLVRQKAVQGQVGSSVMPQKVNPWQFEAAEAYCEKSNALIQAAKSGLIETRFERDLSDHPWERSYGEMLANSLTSIMYLIDGFKRIETDKEACIEEVRGHPEVLLEAVQIAGRVTGKNDCYKAMSDLFRGKQNVSLEEIRDIIDKTFDDGNPIESALKQNLMTATPESYVGMAQSLTEKAVKKYIEIQMEIADRGGILHKAYIATPSGQNF